MQIQLPQVITTYQGRIPRRVFWGYTLAMEGIVLIADALCVLALIFANSDVLARLLFMAPFALSILLIVPQWRVMLKRCHDRNHSGAYIWLFALLPVLGPLWVLFECAFLKGTTGPNRFGPQPG